MTHNLQRAKLNSPLALQLEKVGSLLRFVLQLCFCKLTTRAMLASTAAPFLKLYSQCFVGRC